jgi:ABC-type amino acid transport substrate-binding protein
MLFANLVACDGIPRDSAGALERARGGELRVGVARNPPFVEIADDGAVSGIEIGMLAAWARQLDARIVYVEDSETELVDALHRRELDVVAAGLETDTPHGPRVALTTPYVEVTDRRGKTRRYVLAVTQGESALLFALDRFLAIRDRAALRAAVEQAL